MWKDGSKVEVKLLVLATLRQVNDCVSRTISAYFNNQQYITLFKLLSIVLRVFFHLSNLVSFFAMCSFRLIPEPLFVEAFLSNY